VISKATSIRSHDAEFDPIFATIQQEFSYRRVWMMNLGRAGYHNLDTVITIPIYIAQYL
jgi:hypothetical protein